MSVLYHNNPKTGDTSICRAKNGKCPFGGEHYTTAQEARQAYEKSMGNPAKPVSKSFIRPFKRAMVSVAVSLVLSMSLSGCGSTIDPKDTSDWQANQPQQSHSQILKEKADELKLKEKAEQLKEGAQKLREKADKYVDTNQIESDAKKGIDKVKELGQEGLERSRWLWERYKSKQNNNTSNAEDAHFQGKSLNATADEVKEGIEKLNSLEVRPERDQSGYNRNKQFGANKSKTIGRIEHRDITDNAVFSGGANSRAVEGSFKDPYTGQWVSLTQGKSDDADLEHIVPLREVYRSERAESPLDNSTRKQIANDDDNLLMVSSSANREKGDKDPKDWLPSYKPGICRYALSYVNVKDKYNLTVDQGEKEALENTIVNNC